MDKFLTRKPTVEKTPIVEKNSKRVCEEINLSELPADPADRRRISKYNPNDREKVRRAYLQRGPCQPRGHTFPQKVVCKANRRFNPMWFVLYEPWLEYSVKKDAAFCLFCYLCADGVDESVDTCFTSGGFKNWKKKEKLKLHVGGVNSAHNRARRACEDLMNPNPNQHIGYCFVKQSEEQKVKYETRLSASLGCARLVLHQGLAFRGHDEAATSNNQGNFLELLKFLADHNEEINKVVLENAPGNHKLSSNKIQIDLTSACAFETTKVILEDIGDDYFSIMVDECRDALCKEQMAVVLRYVDKKGHVIERFLEVVHVTSTTSLFLKEAIDSLLTKHKLSVSCLSPRDSFSSFDKAKLVRLAEFYPSDFSQTDCEVLTSQLDTYLYDMKSSIEFMNIKGIGCLAAKLVEMRKDLDYPLVYQLIKLALVLPVSTATVERAFSAMKIVKSRLRNKMGDEWMNACLVTYIEKEVFKSVVDEVIMARYQVMSPRRCRLPMKS